MPQNININMSNIFFLQKNFFSCKNYFSWILFCLPSQWICNVIVFWCLFSEFKVLYVFISDWSTCLGFATNQSFSCETETHFNKSLLNASFSLLLYFNLKEFEHYIFKSCSNNMFLWQLKSHLIIWDKARSLYQKWL